MYMAVAVTRMACDPPLSWVPPVSRISAQLYDIPRFRSEIAYSRRFIMSTERARSLIVSLAGLGLE
jgi:hypothetical protein